MLQKVSNTILRGHFSDLHAADPWYHVDCRQRFVHFRSLPEQVTSCRSSGDTDEGRPSEAGVEMMKADWSRMWDSTECSQPIQTLMGICFLQGPISGNSSRRLVMISWYYPHLGYLISLLFIIVLHRLFDLWKMTRLRWRQSQWNLASK